MLTVYPERPLPIHPPRRRTRLVLRLHVSGGAFHLLKSTGAEVSCHPWCSGDHQRAGSAAQGVFTSLVFPGRHGQAAAGQKGFFSFIRRPDLRRRLSPPGTLRGPLLQRPAQAPSPYGAPRCALPPMGRRPPCPSEHPQTVPEGRERPRRKRELSCPVRLPPLPGTRLYGSSICSTPLSAAPTMPVHSWKTGTRFRTRSIPTRTEPQRTTGTRYYAHSPPSYSPLWSGRSGYYARQ